MHSHSQCSEEPRYVGCTLVLIQYVNNRTTPSLTTSGCNFLQQETVYSGYYSDDRYPRRRGGRMLFIWGANTNDR
jgi:hypothetical protein